MRNLSNEIKAYALKNALEFGKAEPSRILPKLFQHGLEKSEIKSIMPEIIKNIQEINSLSGEEQKNLFFQYEKYAKVHEEKERQLSELPNVSGKTVFRIAPFPSGALHIGNAKTFLLNALYAEKYDGKILLVMDDTIGSQEKPLSRESYKLIEEALEWLDVKYAKPVIYKSDRLEIYYKYAIELIKKNKAYVCHCSQKILHNNREKGIDCACRDVSASEQLERWKKMFKAKEGAATLRIKTSMQHPNPAFRDRVLFKISDRKHPRAGKKYRVWPALEMSWAIDDYLLNVTHVIRGSELQIETDMEKYIWDIFGWRHSEVIHTGLVSLEGTGAKISKSKSQREVKSGKFFGWDDPRTWSIQSLKKRGIKKEAIREFVKEIGLNKQNITAPVESLYAINRKIIDSSANRYSFVYSPVELKVKNRPDIKSVKVQVHPDKKETRTLDAGRIYISKPDFDKLRGKEARLIHLYNVKFDKIGARFVSLENKDIPKINWVSDGVNTEVLMPDGSRVKGIAESSIERLKNSEIIQFERFGFVAFNKKRGKTYEFWFAHK